MFAFVINRLLQSLLAVLAVLLLAFALFYYIGDPGATLLPPEATPAERTELRSRLGLDQPVPVQFAAWLGRVAEGDLGHSYRQGRPVAAMLADALPATLELAVVATVMALAAGVLLGVFTALARDHPAAHAVMALSLIGVSLPTFLTAVLLIQVFAVDLGWLPSGGRGEVGRGLIDLGGWTTGLLTAEGWQRLLLPALTLALFQTTLILRLVRIEMLQVLDGEVVRMARARGLPRRLVWFRHALKNTLVPVVTVAGLQFGVVVAFAVVTETVFNWPGLGKLFLQAVRTVDIPVMAGYFLVVAVAIVVINLLVDLFYLLLDPRLRHPLAGGASPAWQ
ncbi:MAG: ABC transporter permease subunit [Alphaproteobacteria bacterium]|jgi:peptide/nickel transport system permease protein|nr:ABC transporter permease subunit [Alphaproteobacteria bacterium]